MPEMRENKIVKLIFEHENGQVRQISGNELNKWLEDVHSAITLAYNNGIKMRPVDWEIVKEGN